MSINFKVIQPEGKKYPTAKALAEKLEGELVTKEYKCKEGDVIINYGNSQCNELYVALHLASFDGFGNFLNSPGAVFLGVSKNETLKHLTLQKVSTLNFTVHKATAELWQEFGFSVVVRHKVASSKGKGIEIISPEDDLPDAPLYTRYFPKTHEFRVHVVGDEVIDYVQKKRMGKEKLEAAGLETADELVRNHSTGWIFARNKIRYRDSIATLAIKAVQALGLDYGAVDILAIFDGSILQKAVVCEINSAPGLSETTLNKYVEAFKDYVC